MVKVKVTSISGAVLVESTELEPGQTLHELARAAAAALGVSQCKLATSDNRVLVGATAVAESGLQDGETLVAAAMPVSETVLRIGELLVEHCALQCQASSGKIKAARDPQQAARLQTGLDTWKLRCETLRQLPVQFDGDGDGGRLEKWLAELPEGLGAPTGLAEFFEVDAWLKRALGRADGSGGVFEVLGDHDLNGELEMDTASPDAHQGCHLATFAMTGYDDDVDQLLVEWRPGRQPRFVAFHHYDNDSFESIAAAYSFSDAAAGADGKLDFMANEQALRGTTACRLRTYNGFVEVLEAVNAEMQRRRQNDTSDNFFLIYGYGEWKHWDPEFQA